MPKDLLLGALLGLVLVLFVVLGLYLHSNEDPIESVPLPTYERVERPPRAPNEPSTEATRPSTHMPRPLQGQSERCNNQQPVQACRGLWLCPEDAARIVCVGREQYVRD